MDVCLEIGHSPMVVLDYNVDLNQHLPVQEDRHWMVPRCISRKAYGCGAHDKKLLDGLTLLLGLPVGSSDPSASLFISMNDQALQSIQAELGEGDQPLVHIGDSGMYARGVVQLADEKLIVLTVMFGLHCDHRAYYLIYDAASESLSLVPHLPPDRTACHTQTPVPVHRDGNYELVLIASLLKYPTPVTEGHHVLEEALCVWPHGCAEEQNLASSHFAPWLVRERCLLERPVFSRVPDSFCAHIAVSVKTRVYWADLTQGVLCCNLHRATRSCSPVAFTFIRFPSHMCIDITRDPEMPPVNMFRTMGRAGDSIKFVFIDHTGDIGDRLVHVWSLDLYLYGKSPDVWKWKHDHVFRVRSIWKQEYFKKAGLPEMVPKCPVLLPNGDLCLLLPNKCQKMEDSTDDFICVLDLPSKKIKWSARLHRRHTIQPTILPPVFFEGLELDPLCPRKFVLSSCDSRLSSISMQR